MSTFTLYIDVSLIFNFVFWGNALANTSMNENLPAPMQIFTSVLTCIGIEFGTAGLRGRMQAGFSSMNALTVIQASQGLAKFIRRSHQQSQEQEHSQPSVIIGRDARHNSKKFAMLAANAFAAEGIRVLWYRSAGPTPLVPFGVLKNREAWGVMVTASHVSVSWLG